MPSTNACSTNLEPGERKALIWLDDAVYKHSTESTGTHLPCSHVLVQNPASTNSLTILSQKLNHSNSSWDVCNASTAGDGEVLRISLILAKSLSITYCYWSISCWVGLSIKNLFPVLNFLNKDNKSRTKRKKYSHKTTYEYVVNKHFFLTHVWQKHSFTVKFLIYKWNDQKLHNRNKQNKPKNE